ncbi:MAG: amidohydrolase family protein [Terriglobales bacterium]
MAQAPDVPRRFTDCHVHLAGLPEGANGCYVSPRLLRSPLFRFITWKHGLPLDDPPRANRKYVDDLLRDLGESRYVDRLVLLAMDGVYDADGKLNKDRTDFLVSNDYVLEVAARYPDQFWAGVSINPARSDAVEEAERCARAGAKLVKVLPNAQQFDPAEERFRPFYRALARLGLPLLSHVGYEFSLIGQDQSSGDPDKLRVPLDEGVTVIAAHGCSYGLAFYEKFYRTFLDLARRYPNFFADISALTLPNRMAMLLRLRRHPELSERLLFGTDYPLPVFSWACWGRMGLGRLGNVLRTKNPFDRQYLICSELGLRFGSFDALSQRMSRQQPAS